MPNSVTDPFASAEDMEKRSQGAITTASHPFLEDELKSASQDIRDFCRWHVAPLGQVTFKRSGRSAEAVWLPAMRIASIDAVTIDGTVWDEVAVNAVEFDENTGWTNLCGRVVEVTYTAGFEVVPANIATVSLELAAGALGTSLGYTREQAGSVSVSFGRAGGGIEDGSVLASRLIPYRIGRLP